MAKLVDTVTDGSATFKVRRMVVADAQPDTNNTNLFLCADKSWKTVPTPDLSNITTKRVNYNSSTVTITGSSATINCTDISDLTPVVATSFTGTATLSFPSIWTSYVGKLRIICFMVSTGSTAPSLTFSGAGGVTGYGLSEVSLTASSINFVYAVVDVASSSVMKIYWYQGATISLS